jgi:rubrerythrin
MAQADIATEDGSGSDYVRFWATGAPVKGEFHCCECGYGVAVHRALPRCPMCGGEAWEQAAWSPFGRALEAYRQ